MSTKQKTFGGTDFQQKVQGNSMGIVFSTNGARITGYLYETKKMSLSLHLTKLAQNVS